MSGENMFGRGGRPAPGGLLDNRSPMKSPPVRPPMPAPPGLGDVDLSPVVGSWSTYHVGTPDPILTLDTLGRQIVSIEIGPNSLWDCVEVKPMDGPAIVLSPGVRYPAGSWHGPIRVRPSVGRPRFPILSTAAFGTWVVSANTYSPQIAVGPALFIVPTVELVAYPSRELLAVAPVAERRAPLAFQASVTGSDAPATTFLAALVPAFGRASSIITLYNANANTWTGVIWGYRGSAAATVVWPVLPATTFTVAVTSSLSIEINGEWDYLGVAGAWDAGAAQALIVYIQSALDVALGSSVILPTAGATDFQNASGGRATTTMQYGGQTVTVPTEPFATVAGALAHWSGVDTRDGNDIRFRVMGSNSTDQRLGWIAPTGKRYYIQDELAGPTGMAFQENFSWWGPPPMIAVANYSGLTVAAITNVGPGGNLSTQWQVNEVLPAWDPATNQWGRAGFLRVTQASGGVEVTVPIQIACQLGTDRLICDAGPNAGGGIYLADGTQLLSLVGPAVEFVNGPGVVGGPANSPDGTWLQGHGSFALGERTQSGQLFSINPWARYNRLTFERAKTSSLGGSFDLCLFYGGGLELRGGWHRMRACLVQGDVAWQSGGRRVAPGQNPIDELKSYAATYLGPPYSAAVGDPRYPHRGPCDLAIMHGTLQIGRDDQDGTYEACQALSVRAPGGGGGITVRGNGSRLIMPATGTPVLYVQPSDNVTTLATGIIARGGAHVMVRDSDAYMAINATTPYTCGSLTAQVGAGAGGLSEVAGLNGNMYQNGSRISDSLLGAP